MNIKQLAEELQQRDVRQDEGDIQLTIFKAANRGVEQRFNHDGQNFWDRMNASEKDITEYIKSQMAADVEGIMHQQKKGRLFQKLVGENKAFRHQTYQQREILDSGGVVKEARSVEQITEAAAQKLRQQEISDLQDALRTGINQLTDHIQKVTGLEPRLSREERAEQTKQSTYSRKNRQAGSPDTGSTKRVEQKNSPKM